MQAMGGHDGLGPNRRELKAADGQGQEQWGKLTDDDLVTIDGKREQLEGALQERYGIAKDEARQHIDDWLDSLND